MKNLTSILLLSQGVPMILAGDEFGRPQQGNNNAYCQDNEIGWVDWSLAEKNSDLLRFFRILIAFRKTHPNLRRSKFEVKTVNGIPEMSWHGFTPHKPQWDKESHSLALYLAGDHKGQPPTHHIYMILNAHWRNHRFELPRLDRSLKWARVIDTYKEPPDDIREQGDEERLSRQRYYTVHSRAVVVLISAKDEFGN
jgi:glycogen operon protein